MHSSMCISAGLGSPFIWVSPSQLLNSGIEWAKLYKMSYNTLSYCYQLSSAIRYHRCVYPHSCTIAYDATPHRKITLFKLSTNNPTVELRWILNYKNNKQQIHQPTVWTRSLMNDCFPPIQLGRDTEKNVDPLATANYRLKFRITLQCQVTVYSHRIRIESCCVCTSVLRRILLISFTKVLCRCVGLRLGSSSLPASLKPHQ